MRNLTTNLALLMELTRTTPADLNRALGIDPSLISRWRTGSRRLSAGSRWCRQLTEYFLQARGDEVSALMARASPLGLSQGLPADQLLARWLGENEGSWEEREELLFLLRSQKGRMERRGRRLLEGGSLSGSEAVRKLLMEFLDYALTLPGSSQMVFFCSEGLELFTRDEGYHQALQEKLRVIFKRGKRIQAVLRTNYRPSDVALACGPWVLAHLLGYIESCYYDDFRPLEHEKILFGLRGRLMVQIRMENGTPQAVIHRKPEAVAGDEIYLDGCARRAQGRFFCGFFQNPSDFLCGVSYAGDAPVYLLERLPDFGAGFETLSGYLRLYPEEAVLFQRQFWPLAHAPQDRSSPAQTRHIFCEDHIDAALDGVRHLCRPMSEICGRRLYLSAEGLAELLDEMRQTLERRPGYQVCFMPQEWFDQIGMELVVWGSDAAVAWVAGRQSAACRDYPNVTALHGFCAALWDKIPPARRSRQAALKRLERWLERARRFGLFL